PHAGPIGAGHFVTPHADCRNGVRILYPLTGDSIREYAVTNFKHTGSDGSNALISTPLNAARGSTISMQFTMENLGTTTNSPVVGIFLSTDRAISSADTRIGTASGASLGRGQVLTRTVSVTIPNTIAPGVYFIGSFVDVDNTLAELDETNNSLAAPQ